MQILKQSTAVDVLIGPFVDRTDGYTAETGEAPTVKLSKNGQTLAAKNDATTPSHDADGYYNCELDATDTGTVGTLVLTVAASANALPVRHEFQVVEEAIYDKLFAASGSLNDLTAAQVNAEVDTALSDYDGPTHTEMTSAFTEIKGATWSSTDTLEAIRDRGDAAWITATGFSTHSAADVWSVATRTLTAFAFSVDLNADQSAATIGTVNTMAGTIQTLDALDTAQDSQHSATQSDIAALNDPTAAAIADAICDELLSGHTTAGSLAKAVSDILADTDELQTNQSNWTTLDAASIRSAVGLAAANLDTQLADLPTVAEFEARTLVAASYFDPSSDTVDANLTQIMGSALTGTAAQIAAGFSYFYDVISPSKTINDCGVAGSGLSAEDVWTYATRTLTAFGFSVNLADDAITSDKYDESTAFPIKSADSGATQIARTGADSDTLETLSDQVDGVSAGSGLALSDAVASGQTAGTVGSALERSNLYLDTSVSGINRGSVTSKTITYAGGTSGGTYYAKPLPLTVSPYSDDVEAMSESGSTGVFSVTISDPAAEYVVFEQAGGSPADGDVSVATASLVTPAGSPVDVTVEFN